MLKTRFWDLAADIEDKICQGVYITRLPAIRKLADIYEVSPATMQKAVTELVKKGIVIPQGAKGNIILDYHNRRPHTQMVGVFCNRRNPDISRDILLQSIQEQSVQSNWLCAFMNIPGTVSEDERFWIQNSFEGYIFLYSSISQNIANMLKMHNIPFVVANRVPDVWGCPWVDFDITSRMKKILGEISHDGGKCVGINLPLLAPHFYEYMKQELLSEAAKWKLELHFFQAVLGGIENAEKNCLFYAERYKQESFCPDAIMLLFLPPVVMRKQLNSISTLWKRTKIISLGDNELFDPGTEEAHPLSYRELGRAAWNLFLRQIDDPELKQKSILI